MAEIPQAVHADRTAEPQPDSTTTPNPANDADADAQREALIRTRLFITGSAVAAIPILGLYAYLEIEAGYLITGVMMAVSAVLILLNAWWAQHPEFGLLPTRVVLFLACMIIIWELIHHSAVPTLLFTGIVPTASIFVFGRREGLIWSLAMWLAVSILLLNSDLFPLEDLSYAMIDFTVAYVIIMLLALGYETLQLTAHANSRRHVEDLRYEQQRLEDFAAVASDWMYELDANLCFTSISEKWSQSLKLPEGALIGVPVTAISRNLHNPDEQRNSEFAASLMKHDAFQDVQFSIRLGKRIVHLTTNGQPIFDDAGEFAGYRGTAKDITEIVNSQQLIREKDAELMQAQKMEAIGQLTSGVAHDFNNLLTVINGNLELMKLTLDDSGTDTSKIDYAMQASDRAAELTNKLLAFARRQPLNPESVVISELITGFHEMLSRTLGEQIEISLDLADEHWICHVDVGLFESAILNLAINARDAMPQGGSLAISSRNLRVDAQNPIGGLEPGEYVRISLTDSGVGIASDELPHVFEPFYTTKPQGEGSGLGLSMVYGFASQSGGHANITSTPGTGTTANVYLPRFVGETASARDTDSTDIEVAPQKILVIEDEADVRELVAAMARTLGHEVDIAANGEEARARLSGWQPDILITDVVLGAGETGPQLAREALRKNPALKVLLISGYPEFALESNGHLGSNWHLLKKPFGRIDLREALQQLFG